MLFEQTEFKTLEQGEPSEHSSMSSHREVLEAFTRKPLLHEQLNPSKIGWQFCSHGFDSQKSIVVQLRPSP